MDTVVLPVTPDAPEPEVLRRAADELRRGELVAFPTETVYGLGANALDLRAVAGIFAAKGRPANNPLIVHVAEVEAARQLVTDWPAAADRLAAVFWPGPLTLVLSRRQIVPDIVTAGGPTVAVRLPAHPVARGLVRETGFPLAAPSANASTRLSPTRAEHVLRDLGDKIALVLDGGPTPGGLESTVLDVTVNPPRLLRPGLISPQQIETVLGVPPVPLPEAIPEASPLPSPGLSVKHYAPRAILECTEDDGRTRVAELLGRGQRVGWLTITGQSPPRAVSNLWTVRLPREPGAYAQAFYAVLHGFDEAGVDWIVVEQPPDTPEWLAVRDRLRRAAARG
jgi:L-threonylcarbamoyladenylate synthase